MKPFLRAFLLLSGASLLLGSDCTFGRPIVDERGRYYPSDGVISCSGTLCADLPAYALDLPPPLDASVCAQDLPTADLAAAAGAEMSLVGMRHVLASERPLEVHLGTLELRDACLVISGPVRVTFGAGSKLTNVTIMLGPADPAGRDIDSKLSARQTPNLYFGHAELDRVVLQALEEGAPSGSAQVEFSTCTQCQTKLDSLNVTESQTQNSRLEAGSLIVVGGAFDSVELSFDYGLLAGVLANNVRTVACDTLSLVGATIAGRASKIGPCDCTLSPLDVTTDDAGEPSDAAQPDAAEPSATVPSAADFDASQPEAGALDAGALDAGTSDASGADGGHSEAGEIDAGERDAAEPDTGERDAAEVNSACNGATISQTTFLAGMVDGKVHAENSSFRSVLFARHEPTSLDLWNVSIELSVICDHPIDVRLDKTSGIGCTSCDSNKTATACSLDQPPQLIVNHCKSFRGELPACEPPLPVRRTPYVPMPPKLGR